jgi:4-hydroxybenzoate polyprenyltransferase
MVDREDDLKLGIRSSAITFGRFDVLTVMICYGITLLLLVIAGKWLALSYVYFVGLGVATGIAIYHYYLIRSRQKAPCFKAFLHNNWFGFAVFTGLAAHYAINYWM